MDVKFEVMERRMKERWIGLGLDVEKERKREI